MRIDLPLIPVDEPEPCAARVPLFTGLDLEQLRRVSALARPLVLEAGSWLTPAEAQAVEGRHIDVEKNGVRFETHQSFNAAAARHSGFDFVIAG